MAAGAGEVLFPRSCVACGEKVEDSPLRHLCRFCAATVRRVEGAHCTTCGAPFDGETAADRICPHCELLVPRFDEGCTAILLRGAGRALVHALKYHHGHHVLEDVQTLMSTTAGYPAYIAGAILVPVPLHPRKLRERGFNQSLLLAECARQAADGRAEVRSVLRRVADTQSQTFFDRAARQANLKNAFALASGAVIETGRRHLLVDDVFTTGSTLNACAAALRRVGCARVDVLTFGHG